ncbi:MAG TPA: hypothetical protein VJ913_03095, partial [Actinomycetota bacterium]|nr:hypothetical protein [Actinomycetota bacterium]
EIELLAGRLDEAEATLSQSTVARLPGPIHITASARSEILRGKLASARGDHPRAVEIADTVIERFRRLGARPFLPAALLLKGTALRARGERAQAETALLDARSEAEGHGFRTILWRIDVALSDIAAEGGDAARAAVLRSEAGSVIEQIAGSIDDPELRSSFLALPDVEAVRSG